MPKASNDPLIHAAIKAGRVTVNVDTGHVTLDGRDESASTLGYLVHWLEGHEVKAHRIMWLFHYPDTPETLQVNHRNGRRWDNRLANLELVTACANIRHGHGLAYESINDTDTADSVMTTEWLAEAMALAARGNATPAEIKALKLNQTAEDRPPRLYRTHNLRLAR